MVHTQEKPYQCSVCGRSYRQVSTLIVHKRTTHGVIEADDGTEIVLSNIFTQKVFKNGIKVLKSGILSDSRKIKTVATNVSYINEIKYILF